MTKVLKAVFFNKYIFIALFLITFIVVRIPFYTMPLAGEDGLFADLFLSNPQNPNYVLVAKIDGTAIYGVPEHPAPMYEIIRTMGKTFKLLFDDWKSFSDYKLTFLLRMAFSLFQFVFFAGLLLVVLSREKEKTVTIKALLSGLFILIIASSPLAVRSSISIQVDGTSGIIMTGLISIVMLMYHNRQISFSAFLPMAFFSALFIGLGKNEWSIVFVSTLFLCLLYCLVIKSLKIEAPMKQYFIVLAILFAGNLAGNFISYLYDPLNYMGGFNVIARIVKGTGYAQTIEIGRHLDLMKERLPFLFVAILLLMLLAVTLPKKIMEGNLWAFLLGVFGFGLLASFLLSAWAVDVRYFAPSLSPLLCACIIGLPFEEQVWKKVSVVIIIICIALPSLIAIKQQIPRHRNARQTIQAMYAAVPKENNKNGCIPLLSTALGYRAQIDFINNSLGYEDAISLAQKHGKAVCP